MTEDISTLVESTYSSVAIHTLSPQVDLRKAPRQDYLYVFESEFVSNVFRREVGAPTLSLLEWSRRCIEGYSSGRYLPYPEYSVILYFIDTEKGYDVARKLDIGIRRNIFTYYDMTPSRQSIIQTRKLHHAGELVNLMKRSGPTLILGSHRFVSSQIRSYTSIDSDPEKTKGLFSVITDSLWLLGLYSYKNIVLTGTLEYATVPYKYIFRPQAVGKYLRQVGIHILVNEYGYELSYSRFDNVIHFLDSKDKLSIQREVLYSFRYPLPPSLSKVIWVWSNMSKPIFPILAFCMFAAFRRNIIFRYPRKNNLQKTTPAEGIVAIINGIVKVTDGQMNDNNKIFEYCKYHDLDFEGLYPIFVAIYLSCLANDIPVGRYDGRRFVELLQLLLKSLNWPSYLTSAMEIYFPCSGKLPDRGTPLVPYSYFV